MTRKMRGMMAVSGVPLSAGQSTIRRKGFHVISRAAVRAQAELPAFVAAKLRRYFEREETDG